MRSVVAFLALSVVIASIGCTSIAGHKVVRRADGSVAAVENVKGLPIAVQTPTMALFILTKSTFNVRHTTVTESGEVSTRNAGQVTEMSLSDEPILLGPAEIYTIDPKRPAAGTIDYEMEFANQYPTKIVGKVEDVTMEQLRELVKQLAESAMAAAGIPGAPGVTKEAGELSVEKTLVSSTISFVVVNLTTGEISIRQLG